MQVGRKVWVQAAALGTLVAADGAVAVQLGAPRWLGVLYVALGVTVAATRVAVARPRRPVAGARAEPAAAPAAPEPESHRAADGRLPRALGYVCLDGRGAGSQLAVQSEMIRAWCADHGLALSTVVHDVEDHGNGRSRPSLRWALEQM